MYQCAYITQPYTILDYYLLFTQYHVSLKAIIFIIAGYVIKILEY